MRNVLIIGNPAAGTGKTVRRVRILEDLLRSRNHGVEVFLTEKPGDARERARNISQSFDRLVVAGGDGTVNEVLNGLLEPFGTPLIHLATGTANQLASHLRIPRNPAKLVPLIESGTTRRIDMGIVGQHRFLLETSAGFDAAVTRILAEEPRICSGYLAYALPIFRAIFKNRLSDVQVQIDGREKRKVRSVIVTKVSRYGGIFVFCPRASLHSGKFDICLFQEKSILAHSCSFLAALLRLTAYLPWMSHATGTYVRIESAVPVPVQIDGTYVGTTPIEIRLIPQVIPVVVAESYQRR